MKLPTFFIKIFCGHVFLPHVPEEFSPSEGAVGIRCKRCGEQKDMCAWCGKNVATMEVKNTDGPKIPVCRSCVGI